MRAEHSRKELTPIDIRCEACASTYSAYSLRCVPGEYTITLFYSCPCGGYIGTVLGPSLVAEDWPEYIDA